MNERIASIVRQVVDEYISRRLEAAKHKKSLVIVLAYESTRQEEVLKAVHSLAADYELSVFASETWYKQATVQLTTISVLQLSDHKQALMNKLQLAEALVLPSISYSYIAKLAMTMDDDPPLHASIAMQLQGKPVIICDDNLATNAWEAPHGVTRRVNSYLRQLQNENVMVVKLSELAASLRELSNTPAKKKLVTAEQVRSLAAKGGRELIISKETIVTPMARDALRHLGVTVKFKEDTKEGIE